MNTVFFEIFGLEMTGWKIFGFCFQACFMARFIVQWIASEKAGRSVVPIAFWFLSIAGAGGLLTYAVVHLKDPVFAFGQSTGMFIYFRNLALIHKHKKKEAMEKLQTEQGESSAKEN